jgi:murein DD-endopeptidase MepM/ murein hydrolase activator NlpD
MPQSGRSPVGLVSSKRPVFVTLAVAIVLLFMLTGVAFMLTGVAQAASGNRASSSRLDENRRQQLKKQAELDALRKSEAELESALGELQSKKAETERRLAEATARHQDLQRQVSELADRIAFNEARVRHTSFLAKSRIAEIYKHPDGGLVEALLLSSSPGEAGRRAGLVTRVTRADRERVEEYLSLTKDLSEDKAALEVLERDAAAAKARVEEEQQHLEETQVSLEAALAEKERRISELLAEIDELEKEEARIQSIIASASSGARGPTGTVPVPGGKGRFGWPVSGVVTSGFGQRCSGSYCRMHNGIDIAAPIGTAVGASAAGTVIGAGSQGGYGNTVIIDHGDGFTTLYAHLAAISVSAGQRVGRGTIVGTVGMTGNSTGPHLHFEIRYNGVPQDPMAYL